MPRPRSEDTEVVQFDGRDYLRGRRGRYFKDADGQYLHRAVWIYHKGSIPTRHDIHHKNGDPADNRIENLECVTKREHGLRHADRSEKRRRFLDEIRPLAQPWHQSEEGKACHRSCGRKAFRKLWDSAPRRDYVCHSCGGPFRSRKIGGRPLYCSPACKDRERVRAYDKVCAYCGGPFTTADNRISTCSRPCAARWWRAGGRGLRHNG